MGVAAMLTFEHAKEERSQPYVQASRKTWHLSVEEVVRWE